MEILGLADPGFNLIWITENYPKSKMLGKTTYIGDNPNDFVWAVPEGKSGAFEKLIQTYLKRSVATRDGRVKVTPTRSTRDAGRDFEIIFSGEIELFGLRFVSQDSPGLIFVECKSTKNERLDDAFIADASQHKDAQALAYILVTNAVITPYSQQRAQVEWRRRDSTFCLVDRRRLADELYLKDMSGEAKRLGIRMPSRSSLPEFDSERLVVSYQSDQKISTGRQEATVFLALNNYRDCNVLADLRVATDIRWSANGTAYERVIPPGHLETIELTAERHEFGGPGDLDLTLSVNGRAQRLTVPSRKYKVVFEPVFVGQNHRRIAQEIRSRAEMRKGFSLISVQGEAGVGKSRTVQEALAPLREGQLEIVPFNFQRHQQVASFKEFCARFDLPDVLSEITEPSTRISRLIQVAAETAAPMVILFENLHHAEDEVIKTFKDLLLKPPKCSAPLILIITGRDDHTYPNQAYFSLLHLVADQELQHAKAYSLRPLSSQDSELLIRSVVKSMPEPGVERVQTLGENNPFVIVEVLQYLLDTGLAQLLSRQTLGVIKPEVFAGRNGLPKSVESLYELRWEALLEADYGKLAAEFLTVASFFGFEVSQDNRQAFFDGEETGDECWALLCERRFVKEDPTGLRLTFAHENLLNHLRSFARRPENAERSAALILDRPGLARRLSQFDFGEVLFMHKDFGRAFDCFGEIWERTQQITNFSSEEIEKNYFRYLPILFHTAKAIKSPRKALCKVALANGYMGVHNFPLMVGEKACAASREMLDQLYPKGGDGLREKLAVRQLRAHALQNMGHIGLALQEMLEIEAAIRNEKQNWPEVEFDLYDRFQAYYRRANHLELARFYGRQARKTVIRARDRKLKAAHLITESVVALFAGEQEARSVAARAHQASKKAKIKRFITYTRLTELIVDTLYSNQDVDRLRAVFEEGRHMLRKAAVENLSDSIMRLDLLLATLALNCFADRSEAFVQARIYIDSGQANSVRFGNGLFDWAFDNLAAIVDLNDPTQHDDLVRARFRSCMERLRVRGLTFVGSSSGTFPNSFAISNAVRCLGGYQESRGIELIQSMITAYDNQFLEDDEYCGQLVRKAVKAHPIFWPEKSKVQMIRYPRDKGYFTPVF